MKRRTLIGVLAVVVALVAVLAGLLMRSAPAPQAVMAPAADPVVETVPEQEFTLYFASSDARYLVPTTRLLRCGDETGCLSVVVEALLAGPDEGLQPVLPSRAILHGLQVDGEILNLDFDAQLVSGHPGGSQAELMSVYALANTIAVNFPHLRAVTLSVDGSLLATLRGHVDLQKPLLADFSFARPPASMSGGQGDSSQ